MRTTVDIDDDVLFAAKELALHSKKPVGAVLSELARRGLDGTPHTGEEGEGESFYGFQPWPRRGQPVTNELVNRLRDD